MLRRLAALLLVPALLGAQASPAESPEGVVRAYLRALGENRWRDAAERLEISQFAEELRSTIEYARRPTREVQASLTVEELRKHDPDMPLAVAEYQVKRFREQAAMMGNPLLDQYAGVPTMDSLATLSPREAAARWLQAHAPANAMRRNMARNSRGCGDSTRVEALVRQMAGPPQAVLGSTVRRDVAFVMVGTAADDSGTVAALAERRRPFVVRTVRWGGRWLIRDWQHWSAETNESFVIVCDPPRER